MVTAAVKSMAASRPGLEQAERVSRGRRSVGVQERPGDAAQGAGPGPLVPGIRQQEAGMEKTAVVKRVTSGVVLSGTVLLLISACAPVGKMTHDMDTMIQSATTKADHEALATHYEQEAKALQAKAADHRRMGQAYAKSGGYAVAKGNLLQHCEALAATYERAASENMELAKQHRQLVAGAPR